MFYKKCKKYNEIQLSKIKMDSNNRKIRNHPSSPTSSLHRHPISHYPSILTSVNPVKALH